MHEMSLMAGMMEIIQSSAAEQGFTKVTRVVLEIGRLSGVEPEAMRFAFDVGTQDSLAEGAELTIEETPGSGQCPACGKVSPLEAFYDPCPFCATVPMRILAGKEMRIKFLDVD